MASFLITGASRGFGLALTRELASYPASKARRVFAAIRASQPTAALEELAKQSAGRVVVVPRLDVTNQESIKAAAAAVESLLEGEGLDVLVNNAGVCQYAAGLAAMDNLEESFTINVMGVHWVTREFLPLLRKGALKKVVNVSTTLGSIALARNVAAFPAPAYKVSKAALNALTVQYAVEFETEGFTFMALCPGWMKTDLGGGDMADLTAEEGAKAALDIVLTKGQDVNGKMPKVFVKGWENAKGPNVYDGTNAPW